MKKTSMLLTGLLALLAGSAALAAGGTVNSAVSQPGALNKILAGG